MQKWTPADEKRLAFYLSLIPASGLIFDIGANLGNRTKIFSRMGARVIAVEPQTFCYEILNSFFRRDDKVTLIKAALGAEEGESEIFISSTHTLSSMSPRWIEAVKESGRFSKRNWEGKENVRVTTLDRMIELYGNPDFIKVDAEGFEDRVISGLSKPARLLSLEFTPEYITPALSSLDHLNSLGPVEFNYSIGEFMELSLEKWGNINNIKERVSSLDSTVFGDIYVRSV
ncbi:MAG: FkbM family methyltransferase [Desulfobacteraceae bacterium]|nr:FkbM family methyltransferase [Desulfobacteraceae bacterium]